nr:esterase E4 [Helicoverpa armigera]WRX05971.1 CCE003a [Helicoverpa armigera]
MRWQTTIWISAALVVTSSALHLTIEHDLLGDHSSTSSPGLQQSTRHDAVHVVSQEQLARASNENPSLNMPNALDTNANGHRESRSNENGGSANVNPDSGNNSGANGDGDPEGNGNENDGNSNENDGNGNGNDGNGSEDNTSGNGNDPETDDNGGNGGNGNGSDNNSGENDGDGDGNGSDNNGVGGAGNENDDDNEVGDEGSDNEGIEQVYEVETTSGRVRGHHWRENKNIIGYIDIKYGTINNPLQASVLADSSETIHDEKDHNKRCPQLQGDQYVGNIDCLTLSIFRPSDASNAAVLVHIHEGNFINGSGNPEIYGPEYLVPKGIILVLPNYRLGPLGFLCLQNETAPGNAALKDLSLALRWLKQNIAKFGGNHDNIAVSGDGTAGALAGYLALSPMSRNNISKVITESGSVLSYWAIDRNPINSATNVVRNINGFQTWQNVGAEQLVRAARDIVLRPCLERNIDNTSHFMEFTPSAMLRNQEIKISFMIGSAQYAGVHEFLNHTRDSIHQFNVNSSLMLPQDLHFKTSEERTRAGNRVRAVYFGDTAIGICDVENLTLYFTDAAYLGPGIRTARPLVDSGATVYLYEFAFVGSLNRELEAIHRPLDGAVRGDIIGYLFTQDGKVLSEGSKEIGMINTLTELWTTFIKTGTPSAGNIEWKKLEKEVEPGEEQWLSIETEPSLKKGLHVERLNVWSDIYDAHFIEKSRAIGTSASVYTLIVLQIVFFITFFKHAWHFF